MGVECRRGAREQFDLVARPRPAHVELLKGNPMSSTTFGSTITTVAVAAATPALRPITKWPMIDLRDDNTASAIIGNGRTSGTAEATWAAFPADYPAAPVASQRKIAPLAPW
jgi:hypothetical protein